MVKFSTNASGAMLLLNLIQVTESISGSVVPLAMFCILRQLGRIGEIRRGWAGGNQTRWGCPQSEILRGTSSVLHECQQLVDNYLDCCHNCNDNSDK